MSISKPTEAYPTAIWIFKGEHLHPLKAVLIISLAYNVLAALQVLARSMGYFFIGHLDKLINPFLLLLCTFWLLLRGKFRKPDAITVLILTMIIMGTMVGFYYGTSLRQFISHFFVGTFMLVLYTSFYNFSLPNRELQKLLKITADYTLWVYVVALITFWILFALKITRYPGFSCEPLLLPLSYYLVRYNREKVVLSMLSIFLSGKRGVLLGMAALLVIYFIRTRTRRLSSILLIAVGGSLLLFFLAAFIAPWLDYFEIPVISTILSKIELLNPLGERFNLAVATGGRSNELQAIWPVYTGSQWHWIFGMGYGWVYEWFAPSGYTLNKHYVHMSVFNYLLQYGLIIAGLFLILLYRVLSRYYKLIVTKGFNSIEYVIFLFFIGKIVVAQTSYGMARDALFWILLGVMAGTTYQTKKRYQFYVRDSRFSWKF